MIVDIARPAREHKLRVMLDADLTRLYVVSTNRLNQQVRRNRDRFPADFMFQLSAAERDSGNMLQIATCLHRASGASNLPQNAGGSQKHRHAARLPLAFTEYGCLMAATHEEAILKLQAEIRRLTQFPEAPRRGIGFTAEWPGDK